jgi:hypothetical protein
MIYTFEKAVHATRLKDQLAAEGIAVDCINTMGAYCEVYTPSALSPEDIQILEALVQSHNPVNMNEIVAKKILGAMQFGKEFMADYGASNVLAGFTIEQIKYVMTVTADLQAALLTGSLYVALDELAAIETDEVIITPAKVTDARHKIQTYLGIPLT